MMLEEYCRYELWRIMDAINSTPDWVAWGQSMVKVQYGYQISCWARHEDEESSTLIRSMSEWEQVSAGVTFP